MCVPAGALIVESHEKAYFKSGFKLLITKYLFSILLALQEDIA